MCTEPNPVRRDRFRPLALSALVFALCACAARSPTPIGVETTMAPHPVLQRAGDELLAPDSLAADFTGLQADIGGSVGLAVMPVGGDRVTTLGNWTNGVAWSTIKVPLALAALRHDPARLADAAAAAITVSDNDAAQTLWDALGGGEHAADSVEAVLRESGDTTTDIADRHHPEAQQSADDSLPFGATVWSLVDQVRFASRLPCLRDASRVVNLMSRIAPEQSWGLGAFVGAAFKGGWGPDDQSGAYLVRQFGLVPTFSGQLAVALAAQPDSGAYDDATAMIDTMSAVLARHVYELGGGQCRK